jgi:hypothetical protein
VVEVADLDTHTLAYHRINYSNKKHDRTRTSNLNLFMAEINTPVLRAIEVVTATHFHPGLIFANKAVHSKSGH